MTSNTDLAHHGTAIQRLVGENVRRFRTGLGLIVDDLAARIGLEPGTVTSIEDGRVDIDIDMLVALADALGTEVHLLVAPEASS